MPILVTPPVLTPSLLRSIFTIPVGVGYTKRKLQHQHIRRLVHFLNGCDGEASTRSVYFVVTDDDASVPVEEPPHVFEGIPPRFPYFPTETAILHFLSIYPRRERGMNSTQYNTVVPSRYCHTYILYVTEIWESIDAFTGSGRI